MLAEILRDRILAAGPIPFRHFMEAALYHPVHGYYAAAGRIGRGGDFYTSSHVDPAFGETITVQLREMAERVGAAAPFWVIEAGPGEGHLAADIKKALPGGEEGAGRFRLALVEPRQALRRVQAERLRDGGGPEPAWWGSLEEAEPVPAGCLVANELLDAMPVHRVVGRGGRLREIFVGWRDGRFVEVEREPSTGAIAASLAADGVAIEDGQQAEVCLDVPAWLRAAARVIGRGYLMIIDYGYPAAQLYAPERRTGTLLAYHRHRATEEFYERVGEQDLTAHVNFTALDRAAASAGWKRCGETTQMKFLIALGLLERFEALAGRADVGSVRRRLALRQLIQPGGMGEVFRVLIYRRGAAGADLRGLSNPVC